jgi:hypothetical protein
MSFRAARRHFARLPLIAALAWQAACDLNRFIPQPPPLERAPGSITTLDATEDGDVGWWPSVQFDSQDRPHVAYCDATNGDVRYAWRDAGKWQSRALFTEGSVGKYVALAIDTQDRLALSFYDQDNRTLRYAEQKADGSFTSEPIAWGREIGVGSQLRFAADGSPHVFFYSTAGKFVHVTRVAGEPKWHDEVLADATGGFTGTSSVRTRADGLWLLFMNWNLRATPLVLGHSKASGFELEYLTLERGAGWRSLVLFDGDAVGLLYTNSGRRELWQARRAGREWEAERLLKGVGNMAAAQAASGDLVVAYEDVTMGQNPPSTLKMLRRAGKTWRRFAIDDEGPVADYLAAAVDSQGRPVIAYHSPGARALRLYDELTGDASAGGRKRTTP